MPLWGSKDQSNNAPKYSINPNSPNTGIDLFNTEVVGLDDGEVSGGNFNHTGWTRVIRGTGPVTNIAITNGGTGYSNADTITVSGGSVNASATLTTDASGVITSVSLVEGGSGFSNTSSATVSVTTTAGTTAAFTVSLGGRAGRVQTETLVALTGMTGNNSTI